ncbi:MAG TPA: hypothetical protein GX709_04640 [Clostridiales bacterium]|nr:hypothetical protein [Clostridiales bacterium]
MQEIEKYKIAFIIIEDNKRNKLSKCLNANDFNCHFGSIGKGTASSELASLWGFSEPEKSIFFLIIEESRIQELFNLLKTEFNFASKRGVGLAFTVPIVSIAHLDMIKHLQSKIIEE